MKQKNINQDLRMRIRNYLEHTHKQFQENNSEHQKKIINKLSPSLLKEMNEDIYKEFIFQNEIFNRTFSYEFLKQTMDLVEEFVATPGEYLFREGVQDDQSIYFVFEGKVQIQLNQQVISVVTGGKFDQQKRLEQQNVNKKDISQNYMDEQNELNTDGYAFFSNFLKKQHSTRRKKSIKMTTIIMDKNKKYSNSNQDCFFDLNRLAEEQSGKIQSKRQNVKDVAFSIISKLKKQQKCFGEYNFFTSQKERLYTAQVQEFSRIYRLKRSSFLTKIKDFKMDFEKFIEIQDEIMLFNHSINLKVPCITCGSLAHQHTLCNDIHFIPNKWSLIQLYNYTENQDRNVIQRYGVKGQKTIQNILDLEKEALRIQQNCKEEINNILFNIEQYISNAEISYDSDDNDSQNSQIFEEYEEESSKIDHKEENITEEDGLGLNHEKQQIENQNYNNREEQDKKDLKESLVELHNTKQGSWMESGLSPIRIRKQNRTLSCKNKSKSIDYGGQVSNLGMQQQQQEEGQQVDNILNQKANEFINLKSQFETNEQSLNYQNSKLSSIISQNILNSNINPLVRQTNRKGTLNMVSSQNKTSHKPINPNISNFIASSMNGKFEAISPLARTEIKEYNQRNLRSKTDLGNIIGEELLKNNRFSFPGLNPSSTLNFYENISNEQLPMLFKDNSTTKNQQKIPEKYLIELIKEKQKGQMNFENNSNAKENSSLLRQVTEHIMKTIASYKQFTVNERDEVPSAFIRNPSHSYIQGNLTELSKNFQFDLFDKMKEYTYYFSHNNYSNVLLQFNTYQDKKIALIIAKRLKMLKKKKNLPIDKIQQQKGNFSKQNSLQFSKNRQVTQKDSDDNSLTSQQSIYYQTRKQSNNYNNKDQLSVL